MWVCGCVGVGVGCVGVGGASIFLLSCHPLSTDGKCSTAIRMVGVEGYLNKLVYRISYIVVSCVGGYI